VVGVGKPEPLPRSNTSPKDSLGLCGICIRLRPRTLGTVPREMHLFCISIDGSFADRMSGRLRLLQVEYSMPITVYGVPPLDGSSYPSYGCIPRAAIFASLFGNNTFRV
jgi:hypothetical protein